MDPYAAVYVRLYPFPVRPDSLREALGKLADEYWEDGLSSLEVYAGTGLRLVMEHGGDPHARLEFNILNADGNPL